ncbi:MAG: ammonium transporter [Myxococcales bacterium]|nr:ammonium transporter [Myxococcales bacterium]
MNHRSTRARRLLAAAATLLCAAPALAEEVAPVVTEVNGADTAWVMTSSALVLLMTPGLALFYGGMVRAKNVLSTLMHSFMCIALVTVQWVVFGYSLAFSEGNPFIGGTDFVLLAGVDSTPPAGLTIPHSVFMVFQLMFAVITPALISGAFAERMKFKAYVIFTLLWATLVYDPICHWVWGPGGWLGAGGDWHALDFAGGTVVHVSSGVAGLAVALAIGPRNNRDIDPRPNNLGFTILGAGLLWFGWFGFNAGSALAANGTAAHAFVATHVAAACAAIAWTIVERIHKGRITVLGAASGAVAGLVGVTPACGFVGLGGAIVIGLGAGAVCYIGVLLKDRFGYDDSLDAFGLHGVGGTWGALATGLFAAAAVGGTAGVFEGGEVKQVVNQAVGVLATAAYSFVVTYLIATLLKKTVGLRVTPDEEADGLDVSLHGEKGYDLHEPVMARGLVEHAESGAAG